MLAPAKRSYVPHRRRPKVSNDALHVTVHAIEGLPNLRDEQAHARIVEAIRMAQERFGCRVIEYSVLSNHLHLIVEARNESKLAQAMKGLLVRIVRALNRLWKRKGSRTLNMDTALYGLTLDLNDVPGKVAGWTMECSWDELGLTT